MLCLSRNLTDMTTREKGSVANLQVALVFLKIAVWFNEFLGCAMVEGLPGGVQPLNDHSIAELWGRVQTLGFFPSKTNLITPTSPLEI